MSKKYFSLLSFSVAVFCLLSMTGCWTTRICTVAPTTEVVVPVKTVYTTQVTTPTPKTTVVKTVTVTNYNTDMSFYLDLNAVAAAYAEANSTREFEQILNSSRYMINNLDLNCDGWVDYLRVIETRNGYYHALLIQACLAPGVFQDVATLVAERRADRLYVEVVGDRYLYGYNYIVRPVFIKRPPMWTVYGQANYTVWSSPYYWGYYPSYYTQPKPVYLNHYQAYVNTYMTNHHYCHYCDYPTTVFYSGYTTMTQPHHRNDYYRQHPDQSFDNRVTRTIGASATNGVSVRNAGQLRSAVNKEQEKKETSTKTGTTSTSTSTRSSNTTSTTSTSTSTRSSSTSTSVKTNDKTPARQPSTQVETRVKSNGATRTTIKTTDSTGRTSTVKRESSNTSTRSTQKSTSTRSTQKSTSTRSSGTSTRSSQDPSKGSNPRSAQPSR